MTASVDLENNQYQYMVTLFTKKLFH